MGMRIDPNQRFKRLRDEAKQETTGAKQQAEEALKRKFASQGLGSSGAAIKAEQQVGKQADTALGRRLGQIESLQEESNLRQQEIQSGRDFAKSEREAGQQFQSGLMGKQQAFSAKENEAGRFLQQKAMDLQKSQFGQQMDLALKQFAMDEETTKFNRWLSEASLNQGTSSPGSAAKKSVSGNILTDTLGGGK